MAILIDEKALSHRQNELRKRFSYINSRIYFTRRGDGNNLTLFATDSSSAGGFENLIKTSNDYLKGSYIEIWKLQRNKQWELRKIYFRIEMKKDITDYIEIMSFHIDLDIDNESYKRYPHIHIIHPKYQCISNAHISLNLNDYLSVIENIKSLDNNIDKIMKMINNEIILPFKPKL